MMKPLFLRFAQAVALVSVAIGFIAFPLRAGCQWDNDTVEAETSSGTYQAIFSFRNTGRKAVTIERVESCCNCTVFTFASTTVNPGKVGTLTITVDRAKGKTGKKTFDFLAIVPEAPPTPLQVVVKGN